MRWGTIPALLADAAARFADREAVVDGERHLRFSELEAEVNRCTAGLLAWGVAPGDRVCIWAPNCLEWIVAALGVVSAGGILVTLNTRFKGPEAAHVIRASGARLLLTVRGFLGVDYPALLNGQDLGALEAVAVLVDQEPMEARRTDGSGGEGGYPFSLRTLDDLLQAGTTVDPAVVAARAAAVQPDDVGDLLFTSGTTGAPKGAMATHAQSLRTFATWASIVGLRAGDRYLVVNPFFHTFGYKAGILACVMTGATILPEPVFDVDRVLERIATERVSVLPGPPTLYQSLLDHPGRAGADLSSLRLGVTGAAVVPVALVVAMREELGFETVLTAYGLTESCGTVTMCRRGDPPDVIAHSSGRAIPGVEVRVVDPEGNEVPRGAPGEIVVRGYTVMAGYFNDPGASAAAVDDAGWLHTGDVGVMDEQGNVRITDRLKDMYVVGGFNAYPAEIEATLAACPAVGEVAVIGVPDERMGEVGCAVVVPAAGHGEDQAALAVVAWARDRLANYKVPRHVVMVEELPRNAAGKVLKGDLRVQFAEAQGAQGARGAQGAQGARGASDEQSAQQAQGEETRA